MFEGWHYDDDHVPIMVSVTYDDEEDIYIVTVRRGYDVIEEEFEPLHTPKDGLMNIQDVEFAVKSANGLIKKIKKLKQKTRKK